MTMLILWLVVLSMAVTWGALGWRASRRWEALYDRSVITRRDEQREHWRALGATYGTVQAAKAEIQEINEQLVDLETTRRLLLRYHEALAVYVGEDDSAIDADALLLNEGRVVLETAGLLDPERREVVS
ncbi:MAG TPA: hypothetical protein VMY76_00775 [Gemmatimonadales bacterium]|nr:hypothetical protein [Gemmatimonadales bacterium]